MSYVRISFVRPLHGREDAVRSSIDKLVEYYGGQPGHLSGYRLEHVDGSLRFGRIGIWRSEEDANKAAQSEHDLALRSELNGLVEQGSHEEFSFEGTSSAAL
ncbi:MAG: hypothetical protein FJ035_00055 [Chloroflexi bacterium]|nr:hypothetical protein [Chloroflexota bacterium]